MGLFEKFAEGNSGKAHLLITISKKEVFEITVKEKEITIDIKNPLLAMESLISQYLKGGGSGKEKLEMIKKFGFKVKVKYKFLEFEL